MTIGVQEFNSYIGNLTSGNYGITVLEMTLDGDSQMLEMAYGTEYIGTANNARYSDEEMMRSLTRHSLRPIRMPVPRFSMKF